MYRVDGHNSIQIPIHVFPSPSNPLKQRQTYEPSVLVHMEFGSHSFVAGALHSSISTIKLYINNLLPYVVDRRLLIYNQPHLLCC